jgi:hypothetical protein
MGPKKWKLGLAVCAAPAVITLALAQTQPPAQPRTETQARTQARAAGTVTLNVKPGLWDVTTEGQASGAMPSLSPDAQSRLTPEQLQRLQAIVAASASKPVHYQKCVTADKIAEGFNTEAHPNADCQQTVTGSSSSQVTIHEECSRQEGTMTMDIHLQADSSEQVSGTQHAVMSGGGRSMTTDRTIHGKWVGASCGSVTDTQVLGK